MPIKRPTVSSQEAQAEKRRIRGLPSIPTEAETPAVAEPAPAPPPQAEPQQRVPARDRAASAVAPPSPPATPSPAAAPTTVSASRQTEFLTVIAETPAPGVSAAFDALSADMGSTKALQAILRKALDAYEGTLLDGSHVNAPVHYDTAGAEVRTSRRFDTAALAVARERFDPFDVITKADLGRKIAKAALATYFARGAQK